MTEEVRFASEGVHGHSSGPGRANEGGEFYVASPAINRATHVRGLLIVSADRLHRTQKEPAKEFDFEGDNHQDTKSTKKADYLVTLVSLVPWWSTIGCQGTRFEGDNHQDTKNTKKADYPVTQLRLAGFEPASEHGRRASAERSAVADTPKDFCGRMPL